VSVADEGPGIPPEELDHVFKRMFRLEDAAHRGADGLGLGLYLCQRIVKAHGGTIRAENRAEGGARITFTLPCREKKADRQTDAGRRREAAG
jgi:signal transduction histidine kinase